MCVCVHTCTVGWGFVYTDLWLTFWNESCEVLKHSFSPLCLQIHDLLIHHHSWVTSLNAGCWTWPASFLYEDCSTVFLWPSLDTLGSLVLVTPHFLEIVFLWKGIRIILSTLWCLGELCSFRHRSVVPVNREGMLSIQQLLSKPSYNQEPSRLLGLSPCSLWHWVAIQKRRIHFLWASSNCFCSCGFLLNNCIIRSHRAKPRPSRETKLYPSFRITHRTPWAFISEVWLVLV